VPKRQKSILSRLGLLVATFALAFPGGWAARGILDTGGTKETPGESARTTLYAAEVGTLSDIRDVRPSLSWQVTAPATVGTEGVVTHLGIGQGSLVETAGQELLRINDRPVTILQGTIPAYRALARVSPPQTGPDVDALQQFLKALSLLNEPLSGVFDTATRDAVRIWQKFIGENATGVVELGDVLFTSRLPVRVRFDKTVAVGSHVTSSSPLLELLSPEPHLTLDFGASASPFEVNMPVLDGGGLPIGRIGSIFATPSVGQLPGADMFTGLVEGVDASRLCNSTCLDDSVTGTVVLPLLHVEVLAKVSGTLVPITAVQSDEAGAAVVVDNAGTRHPVVVVREAQGMAVVSGIEAGMQLQITSIEG
jgi:peptidoglycan hydrolase-like protein with peptidoglycan-binding domain